MIRRPPQKPFKLGTSRIKDTLLAVLEGNKRLDVGRGRYKVFPTSASEATFPQKVRRG